MLSAAICVAVITLAAAIILLAYAIAYHATATTRSRQRAWIAGCDTALAFTGDVAAELADVRHEPGDWYAGYRSGLRARSHLPVLQPVPSAA